MKKISRACLRSAQVSVPVLTALALLTPVASAQVPAAGGPNGVEAVPAHPGAAGLKLTEAQRSLIAASGSSRTLSYRQQVQKHDEWCWAADGASVEQFHGDSTTQEQFCAATKGTAVGDCPNETAAMSDIAGGFRATGFEATDVYSALSWNDMRRQIDAGNPAITVIDWSTGGAHAQTIYGYDAGNQTISVGDPWGAYQRYQTYTYDSYLSNSRFSWDGTISGISRS
ncbi:papain-like cysteine protease family protein [Amycolatopsis sp. PS_44_ISF1]|uniref:papain-like cysteine protease family protein n=1 Tax=Amycolatopsis sp. PS_44_ISF1 TaxID=2974917 RepID=UPI0028DEAA2F|nr:papain-like cysteine protease family protein [Amycolatopsis sp. PS_44_ISF1]MDT8913032.1 C39 family peptidase [Amycolatopsis sp. PS_44_ISF1]